jgi:hypothetical protein
MASASNTQPVTTPAQSVAIFRKDDGKKPYVINKSRETAIRDALRVARVNRPGVVEFFLSGAFAEMESIPQTVIDNPIKRSIDYPDAGFIIPESDLGRAPKNGVRNWQSTCEANRLWVRKYFVETGVVRISELSVILIEG